MFINKEAAKRILGVSKVDRIYFMHNSAIGVVYFQGNKRRSTLVSRKKFLEDAINIRTNRVNQDRHLVSLDSTTGLYQVRFLKSDKTHTVNLQPSLKVARCSCEDFQNQQKNGNGFTKPFCSHLLAVARHNGFGTLQECLRSAQKAA